MTDASNPTFVESFKAKLQDDKNKQAKLMDMIEAIRLEMNKLHPDSDKKAKLRTEFDNLFKVMEKLKDHHTLTDEEEKLFEDKGETTQKGGKRRNRKSKKSKKSRKNRKKSKRTSRR